MSPVPSGFGQVNLTGTAQTWATIEGSMGIPAAASQQMLRALVQVTANAAMVRVDGGAPTTTVGILLPVGYQAFWMASWIRNAQFINQGAGAATLTVQYLQ